jgi:quercetin dioxygenase-like cupin family protein
MIMTDSPYFVTPAQAEQHPLSFPGGLRRTMGITDRLMLLEVYLQRGTIVPEHHHAPDQIGYIVHGQVEFTIAGETRILNPGDSYAVPGDVLHSARALIDTVLVEVFTPVRDEFRDPPRQG